jgi:hypothetical protein
VPTDWYRLRLVSYASKCRCGSGVGHPPASGRPTGGGPLLHLAWYNPSLTRWMPKYLRGRVHHCATYGPEFKGRTLNTRLSHARLKSLPQTRHEPTAKNHQERSTQVVRRLSPASPYVFHMQKFQGTKTPQKGSSNNVPRTPANRRYPWLFFRICELSGLAINHKRT